MTESMENLKIKKAILHILDSFQEAPVLSAKELEIDHEVSEFLEKHIAKVWNDEALKKATFEADDNLVFNKCNELNQKEAMFAEISSILANRLFSIMKQNPDIPSGDLIFALFEVASDTYLGMFKLNYRNSFTHFVSTTGEGNSNQLIKQKNTLPGESQKVDEGVIVNLVNFDIKLLEKQYEIGEKKEYYLAKYFLKGKSELSYKQKLKVLDKAVSKVSKEHLIEDFKTKAKLKSSLSETLEETNEIRIDKVADKVFGENNALKREYIEEVKKAGLVENTLNVPETSNPGKKFSTQKLKTDSGIEINFPSHYYDNQDFLEFINNPDGTMSILIKNVNKVMNK